MANVSSSNGIEKYPRLRFSEFVDKWNEIKFSDLFSYIPNNTFSRADLNYELGEYKNVHYGDVLIRFGPILDAGSEALPYITGCDNCKKESLLMDGDVIIADTAEDETVGKATEIINIGYQKIVSGLHTIACRPVIKMAPTYLGFYINTENYHKQLFALMQGVKVLSISKSNIEGTTIRYPNLCEQTKICSLLTLLESRLGKQRELIEHLKKYKRGVEKLLFKGHRLNNGCATRIRLGDVCEFFSGGTPSSGNRSYYGGNIPFIRSGGIHSEQTELFLTESGLKSSAAKMVEKGDLLFALYGATSGEVGISRIEGAINQAILCIRPHSLNKVYLKHLLSHNKINIINTYLQGGQGNLSAEIIKGLSFDVPNAETQNKIAEILDTIDKRIYYAEKTKQAMELFKKGMLHRLFI